MSALKHLCSFAWIHKQLEPSAPPHLPVLDGTCSLVGGVVYRAYRVDRNRVQDVILVESARPSRLDLHRKVVGFISAN